MSHILLFTCTKVRLGAAALRTVAVVGGVTLLYVQYSTTDSCLHKQLVLTATAVNESVDNFCGYKSNC